FGLNVNVLLLALFATGRLGRSISSEEVADAHHRAAPWDDTVVKRLRSVRRELKKMHLPTLASDVEAFRERIKAVELEAEHLQQRLLAGWVASLARPLQELQDVAIHLQTARNVVGYYCAQNSSRADTPSVDER